MECINLETCSSCETFKQVEKLGLELEQARIANTEKEKELEQLRHRVKLLEKHIFGPRSERIVADLDEKQGVLEELMAEVEFLNSQINEGEEQLKKEDRSPSRAKRRRRSLEMRLEGLNLPEKIIHLDIPEEQKKDPETGEALECIGEEISRKLAVTPASHYIRVYVRPKYAVKKKPELGIQCAPMPETSFPGSQFDESHYASVVVNKVVDHLPLYRQEDRLKREGIELSRQTLSKHYMAVAEALRPLYDELKRYVLSDGAISTDDTPVRLLVQGKGKTVTGRMWVYVNLGKGHPYRLFDFTADRSKSRPKAFLGDYRGYILADAYAGYDDLFTMKGNIEAGCWMHVRRKFVEAEDAPAYIRNHVLRKIRHMYRYERFVKSRLNDMDKNADKAEELKKENNKLLLCVRQEKIAPLIDRLFKYTAEVLKTGQVLPDTNFAKAIGYMLNLGKVLKTFCNDTRLDPDNRSSENALRPLAVGRRNWLFAGSKKGGDATGILLSIVQSCRVVNVDPFKYLTDVLRRIQGHNRKKLHELFPHKWKPQTLDDFG